MTAFDFLTKCSNRETLLAATAISSFVNAPNCSFDTSLIDWEQLSMAMKMMRQRNTIQGALLRGQS